MSYDYSLETKVETKHNKRSKFFVTSVCKDRVQKGDDKHYNYDNQVRRGYKVELCHQSNCCLINKLVY